jgi:uncharacterized membrane protein YuzA (DUF378 family)
MEAGKVESVHLPSPPGVEFALTEQGARVRARAGTVSPLATLIFLISALCAGGGGLFLANLVKALLAGQAHGSVAASFAVYTVLSLAGLYCAGLCLWTMIGHATLMIRGGTLLLGNPWLLGLRTGRFDLSKVRAFSCAEADCGLQADAKSRCCSWSSVDYKLHLESDGRRVSIFAHLPREAKDWLRDRLNAVLAQKQLPRD